MAIKTSYAVWIAGAALSAASLVSGSAFAVAAPTVPATLTQQGRILDATGAPVSSKVKIVFSVYADAKGGTALWTEEQNITLDDGYFSAQLGSVTAIPAGVFDGSVRYIGVTVGADAEMAPREAVTSVPYAMKADIADVASSAAFTSLTGIPAPCAAGNYLKGYDATGLAQCAALPALSCTVRYTDNRASMTSVGIGCNADEVMTGGGCLTNGYLQSSYQNVCITAANEVTTDVTPPAGTVSPLAVGPVIGPPIIIPVCFANYKWTCNTVSSASIRAYATCCKVL
jgi:hypothetical protein